MKSNYHHIAATLITAAVVGAAGASALARAPVQTRQARARVDFNREVQPILEENCFLCHGLDTNKRYGGLRLDRSDWATRVLASGKTAILPGKPEQSEVVERIEAAGPQRMPPPSSGKRLTPAQIDILRRWIAQGAVYAPHWSYAPIVRPRVPSAPGDAAGKSRWRWARGAIDRFLLARLDREKLHPSPEADRRTLLRRVTLDLTGLPPTLAEVQAFVRDNRPDAYERVVDRLLASEHYGERMAQYWLDMVRYADTVGYHGDQDVSDWPYRDYVIRSFNSDKPFDAFTREQLGGDLMPNATMEDRVASGYNRLGEMTAEGGVQDKEYRAKYAADRVRNAAGVWMGATLACAECHDHKYDLYTQKDFYRFEAFFADLKEQGFYGGSDNSGEWGPTMKAPSPEQTAKLAELDTRITLARRELQAVGDAQIAAGRERWEALLTALDSAHLLGWTVARPLTATSSGGATMTIGDDSSIFVSGKLPAFDTYTVTIPAARSAITGVSLEALGDDRLPGNGISRSGWYFVLSEVDAAVQQGAGAAMPVKIADAQIGDRDEGHRGEAMIDGRADTGWATDYGHMGDRRAVLRFAQPVHGDADTRLIIRLHFDAQPRLQMGKFRLSLTSVPDPDLSAQALPDNVVAALRKDTASRTPTDLQTLADYYRKVSPELAAQRLRVESLEGARSVLQDEMPKTLVSEATSPRTIRVLPRGNWMDDSGEVVQPGVPHFLRQIPGTNRATRLDLATWLVSADNPLTSRVLVNRLWKLFFGVGIAKNLDDFGAQGEMPVHPELLDWLASELMKPTNAAKPWSIKHVVRLMVTSAAYRQTSVPSADLLAKDPDNRLYARQAPVRLDAEFVRDGALAVSGLLCERLGGPSVYPYEPRGYLAPLNFPRREWSASIGDDQYRRGIYTHWQRTFLQPSLLAFDAPTREEFACTRTVSNTPMQALALMNDATYVEAARVFAARIVRSGGASFNRRLDFAFDTALSRPPTAREAAILRRLYDQQRARYTADTAAAEELLHTGDALPPSGDPAELAAWTSVARAILNLHEMITRS